MKRRAGGDTPRVAVVGAGAVGCYYGAMLALAGVPVTFIGRPVHVQAMQSGGLRLTTAAFDRTVAVDASTDAQAAAGANVVLVCVKSFDTEAAGKALAPHLRADAAVFCLQNGVDNAARLEAVLGHPVRPAVVYVASEMAGPGHVRHLGRGELVLGCEESAGTAALAALFERAGVPVRLSTNIAGALWTKLVLNCAWNALSAIANLPYGELARQPGMPAVLRDAVAECMSVAHALGATLEGDVLDEVERIARTMPAQYSSTAQDLRRGKPTEIDHLNGAVVRHGARLGIATPVNRTLLALVKALEAHPREAA